MDCNIIKVVFDDLDGLGMKYEWIFRGSDRIETVRHHLQKMLKANPLKRTLEAESCVSVTNLSTSTKTSGKASSIRYLNLMFFIVAERSYIAVLFFTT